MQNMLWKLGLIVVVLGLSITSLLTQEIRLGKDLRGGVSLVYRVDIPEGKNAAEVLTDTIAVLKDRVNPTGVLDISMEPLGRDRIEVVMPLPDDEVRGLADAYEAAMERLVERSEIRSHELDEALRQGTAPDLFGGAAGSTRNDSLTALQNAYDEQTTARAALAEATEAGAGETEIARLEIAQARAENAYDELRAQVLALSLPESRMRRVLQLPTTAQRQRNADGSTKVDESGKPVEGPSQREESLAILKSDFADVATEIDDVVATFDAYRAKRKGLDDAEDLIRLLRGAGVLEFFIAVTNSQPEAADIQEMRKQLTERGPSGASSPFSKWYPINNLKQWYEKPEELAALERDPISYFARRDLVAGVSEGEPYLLLFNTIQKSMTHDDKDWAVSQAGQSVDNLGRPAVTFNLDATGAGMMGRLTASHLRRPMAIVLDGEVYSAPTIQSQITSNGQITGRFTQEEVSYLKRVLEAGSLPARLSKAPIATNTLGPSIGQDNLARGAMAFKIAIVAVAVFMIAYYFLAGVVAVAALAINGLLIFGVMMAIDGTFTLPGLAGIVLTIGMAVDANVLIYERIREELMDDDQDLRSAVRQGYRKALSTILDGNITNLIVCFVLFKTATTEIKGFALTLTIGICATLFTALFVTRQFYYFYTDVFKAKSLAMLPTVFPGVHRALEPDINWVGMRKIFWTISTIAVVSSIILVRSQGVDMFDTEFRGGVSVTMLTAVEGEAPEGGEPPRVQLRHTGSPESVEERVQALGVAAGERLATATDEDARRTDSILRELQNAHILTAGATETDADGNVLATAFQVKVASPRGIEDDTTITDVIVEAIVDEFGDELDVTEPLAYDGAREGEAGDYGPYVFPIRESELGKNIGRPSATQMVPQFRGGAGIVLRNVDPPVGPDEVLKRLERMRNQPDFVQLSGRDTAVYGLTPAGDGTFSELAIVVFDENYHLDRVDPELWYRDVAAAEWELAAEALQKPTSLEQVSSYSSAVADTLAAQAVVSVVLTLLGILVYIWFRFGSLRYSVAAIAALVHDVAISLGLLALTIIIGGRLGLSLIEPFRIDLGVVAALLTIIGYSLNDTIVILDRVRENRGKLPLPTAAVVNKSINQTVSRTLLTSLTTLLAIGIMYIEGGSGIRAFAFCLLIGVMVGTYSSVAIAAPLVFSKKASGGTRATTVVETSTVAKAEAPPEPTAV